MKPELFSNLTVPYQVTDVFELNCKSIFKVETLAWLQEQPSGYWPGSQGSRSDSATSVPESFSTTVFFHCQLFQAISDSLSNKSPDFSPRVKKAFFQNYYNQREHMNSFTFKMYTQY